MPLPPPNYTQAPNVLLDELLPLIDSLSELKVTLAVVRATIGWHEDEVKLTYAELQRRTGLSRDGVARGVSRGLDRGTLERRVEGSTGHQETFYTLNIGGQESRLHGGLESRPQGADGSLDARPQGDPVRSGDQTASGQEPGPPLGTRAQEAQERNEGKKTTPPYPLASEGDLAKWKRVMEQLESCVPDYTFHLWLKQIELVGRRDAHLFLQAPDRAASWARERYLNLIENCATAGFGPAVTVEILESETERARKAQQAIADQRPPRRRRQRRSA